MKCSWGGARNAPTPGNGEARKLRQGLPAQAGAAGAEDNDIGRAVRELTGRVSNCLKIVVGLGQAEQRQAVVRMADTEPIKCRVRTRQNGLKRIGTNAVLPYVFFARIVDGLDEAHTVNLPGIARNAQRQK